MKPAPKSARVRLQKFLSDAGVASRRHAEDWIVEGRVLVNDQLVTELPAFVDPQHDRVVVNGELVHIQPPEYWMLNKPKGVVCTNRDPSGRRRAVDFLPPTRARLFVVGRLDAESSGLVLLTNDGELALRITHPRFGMPKVYWVEVRGEVSSDLPERMRKGVYLAEGRASASHVKVLHRSRELSALEITLQEARNRQVRRMLAKLGYPVKNLKRVQVGSLHLDKLPIGAVRPLMPGEIGALRRFAANAEATSEAQPLRRVQSPTGKKGRRLDDKSRVGGEKRRGPVRRFSRS